MFIAGIWRQNVLREKQQQLHAASKDSDFSDGTHNKLDDACCVVR